jgi:hypothetical protein
MSTSKSQFRQRTERHHDERIAQQVDQAARVLARGASRRTVLSGLAGAALVALGLGRPASADTLIVVAAGEACGATVCGQGEYCCNPSCGICAPLGGGCTAEYCSTGEPCGATTCGAGEYCCNPSCGICAPIGGGCTAQYCSDGEACGPTTCGVGEYCCNSSCGICAPLGGGCIALACV